MKPSNVALCLEQLLPLWRRPLFLWGPPGVGKSDVVRQVAGRLDLPVRDIRASLLDAVDLRGLPRVNGHRTSWCPPDFWPAEGAGVLFLDELPQAPPLVQAGLLQLILDRQLGEYRLPDGWAIVAAGNRQQDRAGGYRIGCALLNRFVHLEMEASFEDWMTWAIANEIAVEVRSFLNMKPGLLHDFDAGAARVAQATPRSWEMASDILPRCPAHLQQPLLAGCVGEGPAAELVGFLRHFADQRLVNPEHILANPTTAEVPEKRPAILFAIVGALTERLRHEDVRSSVLAAFATYCQRLPDPFQVLALRDAIAINQRVMLAQSFAHWLAGLRERGLFGAP